VSGVIYNRKKWTNSKLKDSIIYEYTLEVFHGLDQFNGWEYHCVLSHELHTGHMLTWIGMDIYAISVSPFFFTHLFSLDPRSITRSFKSAYTLNVSTHVLIRVCMLKYLFLPFSSCLFFNHVGEMNDFKAEYVSNQVSRPFFMIGWRKEVLGKFHLLEEIEWWKDATELKANITIVKRKKCYESYFHKVI